MAGVDQWKLPSCLFVFTLYISVYYGALAFITNSGRLNHQPLVVWSVLSVCQPNHWYAFI